MYDKQVRRRRAVLLVLVVISLVLLTDYFGESSSSPLHRVQRGIVAVLSPIQAGASAVFSPVSDVANWASTTLRAKTQRDQLEHQVAKLNAELAQYSTAAIQNKQLTKEVGLNQSIDAAQYDPVGADVIQRDPNLWYQQVELDKGSGDGVAKNDPVLADGALVGKVSLTTGSSSYVTLITDSEWGGAAQVNDADGDQGVLVPAVGNPNQMVLQNLKTNAPISAGQLVVTVGFTDPSNPSTQGSLYPPGIPIGRVATFNQNELINSGQVPVTPLASVRTFGSAQILTRPHPGDQRAQVP